MFIVSYDIKDDLMRQRFSRMLMKNGAIRLQFSVYEIINTPRVTSLLLAKIEAFSTKFTADDSVVVFETNKESLKKYGNAIYRDKTIVFF